MQYRILYILLFLLACSYSRAQDNYKFTSYTVEDGLPQSSIWSILQDKNGFLWVSTADGLCRFDGYDFTVFRNIEGDTNSFYGRANMNLFEDAVGNIWIAHDKGISKYDVGSNRFINIYTYKDLPQTEIFNKILGQDNKGNIWAGLLKVGLIKIDGRTNKIIETISNDDLVFADGSVWFSGLIDKQQRLWFTKGNSGLFCYNIAEHKLSRHLTDHLCFAIYPINDKALLISSEDKLILFNKEDSLYSFIDRSGWDPKLKILSNAYNISSDKKGHLLLCCRNGMYVFDTATKKMIHLFSTYSQNNNADSFTYCAYSDHSGNLWIGTNGDGVKKLMNDTKRFRHYSTTTAGGVIVKSIFVHDSLMYVGCFGNGIDVYDMDKGYIKNIRIKNDNADKIINTYAIADIGSNNALMISSGHKNTYIGLYDLSRAQYKNMGPKLMKDVGFGNYNGKVTPFVAKIRRGLIFGWNSSLVLASGSGPDNIHFDVLHKFDDYNISCGYEDHNGRLYAGTTIGFYLQNNKNEWVKGGLPSEQLVKTICEAANGDIWVGTTNGIYVFDHNKLLIHYTSENGLKNEFIYGILRDDRGRMWFSHNKGISVFDPVKKTFHHYTGEDGLQSNEFNTGAYYKCANGMILFGGINAVNAFFPDSVRDNQHKPHALITGIKVFDIPIRTDTPYCYVHSLTLPYDRNTLTFDLTALEFTDPNKNQYRYMMESLDNGWTDAGLDHRARYPALPPGQYVFKVIASNNDGIWQDVPTTISITIVPPYWQQWWFRVLCILISIGFVTGGILWIQKQRHRRQIREMELQQKIQLERERISRDLHDNVGTQLSLISNNIEWVAHPLKAISESEKAEKLQFVNDAARDIIATLRETIWALNKEHISLEEFYDKLKAFVQKQMALYPQTILDFSELIDDNVILGP